MNTSTDGTRSHRRYLRPAFLMLTSGLVLAQAVACSGQDSAAAPTPASDTGTTAKSDAATSKKDAQVAASPAIDDARWNGWLKDDFDPTFHPGFGWNGFTEAILQLCPNMDVGGLPAPGAENGFMIRNCEIKPITGRSPLDLIVNDRTNGTRFIKFLGSPERGAPRLMIKDADFKQDIGCDDSIVDGPQVKWSDNSRRWVTTGSACRSYVVGPKIPGVLEFFFAAKLADDGPDTTTSDAGQTTGAAEPLSPSYVIGRVPLEGLEALIGP